MPDSFATLDDLKARLQDATVDDTFGQMALDNASALIRAYCGWPIAPTYTETVVLDSDGGQILQLPALKVTDVATVLIDGDADIDFTWSAAGMLHRSKAPFPVFDRTIDGFVTGGFPQGFRRISVTYTAGYDPVPFELRAITLEAAARQYINPDGFKAESIGGYSYQLPSVTTGTLSGTVPGIMLAAQEMRVADRYRILVTA